MKKRRLLSATMAFLVLVSTFGFAASGLIFIPDNFGDFEVTEPWETYNVFFEITDENGIYVESGLTYGTSDLALTDEHGRGVTPLNTNWNLPVTLQPQHSITFRPAHDLRGWEVPGNWTLHWGYVLNRAANVQVSFHRNTSPTLLGQYIASGTLDFRGIRNSTTFNASNAGHISITIRNVSTSSFVITNFDNPWVASQIQPSWHAWVR